MVDYMRHYMNLLPSLEELIPIVDKNNIFYECGFNVKFNNFPFQKKITNSMWYSKTKRLSKWITQPR